MNPEIAPAIKEIHAVLKKYDMAGLIIVANKTHTDYLMEIEPSWSCARLEQKDDTIEIRVRSKLVDYPSPEAQKDSLEKTVGVFVTFHDILRCLQKNVETVLVMIGRNIPFDGRSTREE